MAVSRLLGLLPLLVLSLCSLPSPSGAVLGSLDSSPVLHQHVERSQIRDELGPLLSPGAVIVDADGGNLTQATQRWQLYASPSFIAAVEVATENDIIETIKYANANSIPFLAVNAGHGEIRSLAGLQNGIQITIRALDRITIHENSATIQGGANNLNITTALWNAKKQTVSGTCECVGFLGPMLGGGHGFIQGDHGLVADNLLEARVILANGSVAIASERKNSDLFWALRGAGHNFGIVTEVTVKTYDVPDDDIWYYETFLYGGDSVEQVFAQANAVRRETPAQFEHYAVFGRVPEVDPVNAIVSFSILYNGPAADAEEWIAPFRALKPLSVTNGTATYPQLASITGNGIDDVICQNDNLNRVRYPIYIDEYVPDAPRAVFDLFNTATAQYPALNNSLMLFEGLSSQAVAAVDIDSTAVPVRDYFVLASPVVTYAPDPSLDTIAQEFGNNLRLTLYNASASTELHAYVNYAVGTESLQSLYGYPRWRLDKLTELKHAYDPDNHFQWYAPIERS